MRDDDPKYECHDVVGLDFAPKERFEGLQSDLKEILKSQYQGFGLDGSGGNDEALKFSRLMLDVLFAELKFNHAVPDYPNLKDRPGIKAISELALTPLPAIATAPNLSRSQKTDTLVNFTRLLHASRFTLTYFGAKMRVDRKLRSLSFAKDEELTEHRALLGQLESSWRKQQEWKDSLIQYLGATSASYAFWIAPSYRPKPEIERS